MMDYLQYVINSIPLVVALVIWAITLERKIARIETDIAWIKKELPSCRLTSADPIP